MQLYELIKASVAKIEAEYLQSDITKHSGLKGTQRELLLRNIIRPFLPKRYGLATGECYDKNGNISRQLDIIVYDDLFSYAFPQGNHYIMPFESVYGSIEVKSRLDKKEFLKSIDNISSLKGLYRDPVDPCQILPDLSIEIKGIKWERKGFTTPFSVVFAYESTEPKTVRSYFHEIAPLNPALMPDMIVLFDKKTIITRIRYYEDKLYPTMNNTYQGFMSISTKDDTLPIFLYYLMCRVRDTTLKMPNVTHSLNSVLDDAVMSINNASVIKFDREYQGDD